MTSRLQLLSNNLRTLYETQGKGLLFHGWHHVYMVSKKTLEFADELHVDPEFIEATGLVHDLNYFVDVHTEPGAGRELRAHYLAEAGFSEDEIAAIEETVMGAHTATRTADISDAAKVLSDADSLFKVMPLTPLLFSSRYIAELGVDIDAWADKIIKEQQPLLEQGIYFYTETAKQRYSHWAETDLAVVRQAKEAMRDPVIRETLRLAKETGATQ